MLVPRNRQNTQKITAIYAKLGIENVANVLYNIKRFTFRAACRGLACRAEVDLAPLVTYLVAVQKFAERSVCYAVQFVVRGHRFDAGRAV